MARQSSPEQSKRWGFRRPRRLKTIALLPTLITLGNGVCGVVAIFYIGQYMADPAAERIAQRAAWLILAAMVFDALDGFVARLTRTTSSFGAQLDSLCDLITFGVAPAFLTYAMSRNLVAEPWARPVQAVCVLYAMCALIRLARFTVETTPDESSHREFAGLPSPAAAGVMASAVLPAVTLGKFAPGLAEAIRHALPGLALATGILMVSRVKYAHVVNRVLKGRRPFVTLIEIALVIALFFLFREFAFFIAFFGYAITGPLFWLKKRIFRKPAASVAPGSEERHGNVG
ncbi:MAG: CDP-diacylglycerol--serine O-phosphatidyltransferase [Planctomycetota bacterium]|nr:MAG: CDP-diacylglycerol--serine O-phosphatidyltransferase [Planctomycetota bacterium]